MAEVLLITALVVALFFLFFIRPARSEERKRQRDLNDLQVGDTVLTRGGFIARVEDVETPEDGPMVLLLRLSETVVVRARTGAIAERIDASQYEPGLIEADVEDPVEDETRIR